jgi:hypothetical protein
MNTYYIAGFPINDELYHYGIPDMEWGKRRFQYENGKLTPEGKERYRKMAQEANRKNEVRKERYGTEIERQAAKDA